MASNFRISRNKRNGVKEKVNILDVVPFRCEHITTARESDGTVVIAFPRFKYEWMRRFLMPKNMSPDIHVRLEEHGTAVWELIDGQRTVRQIIEKLAAHFHEEANYESRITTYILQLQKDGFIRLLYPPSPVRPY